MLEQVSAGDLAQPFAQNKTNFSIRSGSLWMFPDEFCVSPAMNIT